MNNVIARPQKPLLGKIVITSILKVETGLHIGGGGENLDIGGLDKPVIRDPLTKQPYLPGSSLKGKLRSILERLYNRPVNRSGGGVARYESDDLADGYTEIGNDRFIRYEGARTCPISRVFGSTGGNKCWVAAALREQEELDIIDVNATSKSIDNVPHIRIKGRNSPARLIVRDCHLDKKSAEKLKRVDTGLYMTEWKFENSIDRITAAANPRQFERVPAGSEFAFEMIYTVENIEQAVEDIKNLAIALAILEDDALGGHGSRGYGKIRFEEFKIESRSVDFYQQIATGQTDRNLPATTIANTAELLTQLGNNYIQQLLIGGATT
jgi:CRISPR-associated protein Csm3